MAMHIWLLSCQNWTQFNVMELYSFFGDFCHMNHQELGLSSTFMFAQVFDKMILFFFKLNIAHTNWLRGCNYIDGLFVSEPIIITVVNKLYWVSFCPLRFTMCREVSSWHLESLKCSFWRKHSSPLSLPVWWHIFLALFSNICGSYAFYCKLLQLFQKYGYFLTIGNAFWSWFEFSTPQRKLLPSEFLVNPEFSTRRVFQCH